MAALFMLPADMECGASKKGSAERADEGALVVRVGEELRVARFVMMAHRRNARDSE